MSIAAGFSTYYQGNVPGTYSSPWPRMLSLDCPIPIQCLLKRNRTYVLTTNSYNIREITVDSAQILTATSPSEHNFCSHNIMNSIMGCYHVTLVAGSFAKVPQAREKGDRKDCNLLVSLFLAGLKYGLTTVEPRFNEPQHNEVLGVKQRFS